MTRQNATFVTLARNSDVWTLARSIQSVEDRFNRHWGYDWVFLNDEPFTAEFKDVTSSLVSGRVFYGQVPAAHWGYPEWINQTRAAEARQEARQKAVMYAASESYRHMCRFFSGFFFRHELLQGYEYYWRVEPETEYYCDIREDPFRVLKEEGKKYGFVISVREDPETINSLWGSVKRFIGKYPEHLAEGNSETWLSDDGGENYNGCHFVSEFPFPSIRFLYPWKLKLPFMSLLCMPAFNASFSGLTSKSAPSPGCVRKPTQIFSTTLTMRVASFTSAGATRRYTQSQLRSY